MLNQTGVTTNSYGYGEKRILVDENNSTAVSCVVANTGVTADSEGKKIIKAGTPIFGSLTDRNTAFTVSSEVQGAKPVGVILHDVDVTAGNANSQVLISGIIDISKVDASVQSALTSAVADLKMIQIIQ